MNFEKLHDGIECDCLEGAFEDETNIYARKVGSDSKVLKDRDFRPTSKLPQTSDCEEICGLRGLSIDKYDDQSKQYVLNKYRNTLGIVPGLKKKMCLFKMKTDCGKVKHTPNQPGGNDPHHHDLYKQDEFVIETHLELVEMKTFDEITAEITKEETAPNV